MGSPVGIGAGGIPAVGSWLASGGVHGWAGSIGLTGSAGSAGTVGGAVSTGVGGSTGGSFEDWAIAANGSSEAASARAVGDGSLSDFMGALRVGRGDGAGPEVAARAACPGR